MTAARAARTSARASARTPTRASEPTRRADEILRVATALFAREGYHSVGMRRIAQAAGVQAATLYHHFASKAEMLFRIALAVTREFADAHLPEVPPAAGQSVPDALRALVRAHVTFYWDRRDALSVVRREMRTLAPAELAQVQRYRRRYQRAVQALVVEGVARGELSVARPRLAALAALDMVNGINAWFRPGGELSLPELAEQYAEYVVDGLLGARRAGSRPRPAVAKR